LPVSSSQDIVKIFFVVKSLSRAAARDELEVSKMSSTIVTEPAGY
jgi:hypothetical protein